jgi:methylated-DNA-[protein]-cysteine S-methyltransferase
VAEREEGRFRATVETPLGRVLLVSDGAALEEVRLPVPGGIPFPEDGAGGAAPPVLRRAAKELREYFAGVRRRFTVPLEPAGGTPFRRAVWEALREIPWGETRSYAWVAARVGRPAACRAVGGANGANPLPIFVPCHRVVNADGSPGGYAGGVAAKRLLLGLEGRPFPSPAP